jgi:hypothetical protein
MICEHCGVRPVFGSAYGDQVCQPCMIATIDTVGVVIADHASGAGNPPTLVALDEHTAMLITVRIRGSV